MLSVDGWKGEWVVVTKIRKRRIRNVEINTNTSCSLALSEIPPDSACVCVEAKKHASLALSRVTAGSLACRAMIHDRRHTDPS